jgi:uncharacterized protein DUF3560
MNTYSKYAPNVFLAKCTEKHEKGEVIPVQTKYGKENESIVFNLVYERDGFFYYSIIRADGLNYQQWAQNRADRRKQWANSAESKSDEYYNKSNKDSDFLSLGEPIKIGHHSQHRHEKLFKQANYNMGKSVEMTAKAEKHESVAEYWERKAKDINLSMPESIDFYTYKLETAKAYHKELKDDPSKRHHSMSLQYANKAVKDMEKNVQLAAKLWS